MTSDRTRDHSRELRTTLPGTFPEVCSAFCGELLPCKPADQAVVFDFLNALLVAASHQCFVDHGCLPSFELDWGLQPRDEPSVRGWFGGIQATYERNLHAIA